MDEEIICIGCGAVLKSDEHKKAGYLPKSALDKARNEENAEAVATSNAPNASRLPLAMYGMADSV